MALHDYRDWIRVDQHAAPPIVDDARAWQVANFALPVTFIGDASAIVVRANTTAGGLTITLTQSADPAGAQIISQTIWEVDQATVLILDTVPVMGNWVQVTGGLTNTSVGNLTSIRLIPVVGSPSALNLIGRGELLQVYNMSVGAGQGLEFRGTRVVQGRAKFNIHTSAASWNFAIEFYTFAGIKNSRIAFGDSGLYTRGVVPPLDLYLPRAQISCSFTNFDAGAASLYMDVVLGP